MRVTVGFKIGGGFFLLALTLVVAGIVGYMGALKLGTSIDNIGSNALRAAQGSSQFSIAVQKQTAITQTVVESTSQAEQSSLDAIASAQNSTLHALDEMKSSGLVNDKEITTVETRYQAYLEQQKNLLDSHSRYIEARENAFKGFNDFEDYMKVVEFFTNQIYNLPNVDQSDKIELTAEFYQSKVALQLRFYYMQRYLGGDEEMLDPLESAEDDLIDETDELMELDLLDNTIRSGRYENQNYIEVLEELVEQHTSQFEEVVSLYQAFKNTQIAYGAAESEALSSTAMIVDNINQLVANETSQASATSANVNKTILVAIGVGALVAILATIFSITRVVSPIKRLAEVASRISDGDLDAEVSSTSEDEVGDLANNFDSMRIQIRKKLMDLQELNSAGETIVSAVDQNEALQKSLETMFNKTNVEQASVFLLDTHSKLVLEACYPQLANSNRDDVVSFGKGEGIAGLSVRDKRIVYVENTKESDLFKNQRDDEPAKSLLCVPLLDGDIPLGVMNFSGEVDQVHFEESDYEFASSIARSVTITIKNIRMREVIEEQNRTLEQKVKDRTQALQAKTNDIVNMMHNMHQGLFTIMEGGIIHHEYATFLEEIFGTNNIANRNFMDLLFANSDLGGDLTHQVRTAIDSIIGEDEMMWEFNSHLLVHEYTATIDDAEKILAIEWDPIVLDDLIDKVMVTVRDVTAIKGLEKEAEAKKRELDIISQILSVDQDKFADFISSSQQFIDENGSIIDKHQDKDDEAISLLFRNMHTIKGNARTYGFTHITDEVHLAENTYDEMRKNPDKEWDQALLTQELKTVQDGLDEYISVCEDVLGRNVKNIEDRIYTIKGSDLDKISSALAKLNLGEKISNSEISDMLHVVHNLNAITFEKSIEDTVRSLESIARQLGKPAPNITFSGGELLLKKDSSPLLNSVFSHLLRNSMDHGIETAEERIQKGKPEVGNIFLSAKTDGDLINIEINDDGKGLDISRLRTKGEESGIIDSGESLTNEHVAELIFKSGMSTKQDVSSISGRGVGMDAVKQFIEDHGGSVSISLGDGSSNDSQYHQFKTILKLPIGAV